MVRFLFLDKYMLVCEFCVLGEVVVVIGDGINDVFVLYEFDIGMVMGIVGIEVCIFLWFEVK